ncbi:hypothetical protein SEA_FRANKLIN22_67 [Microbacterium phage Franklin22]|uniref:hypothetical protein n=1 Tax=Microbacterium phage Franklin22 TaxID=2894293 RepID=UPI001E6E68E5|nr:hypothetical protein QDW15_gp67 [Microbacterium phage Franklin22]UGL61880.1 hypothetical protein SEA_FRANKLIN22_67 [Microbacterium phage Franklin22]
MATAETRPPVGYTISLFVSKTTPEHTVKEGYENRTFPRDTVELARVELRGSDLEALLSDSKEHIDLIRPEEKYH